LRHHDRHRAVEAGKAGAEDDFVSEQRVHRLHAVGHLFQQASCIGIPPGSKGRVLRRLLLGERESPIDCQARVRDRAKDDGVRRKRREKCRVVPQVRRQTRQPALDFRKRSE
jgi:hypothetical protein